MSPVFGEIEVDKSYFVSYRKGKRGQGTAGKILMFCLPKRAGEVYVKEIPDGKGKMLKAILDDQGRPDSIMHSDTLNLYNMLNVSAFKHLRINCSSLFVDQKNHINWIENLRN